jgi:hypothetical protein
MLYILISGALPKVLIPNEPTCYACSRPVPSILRNSWTACLIYQVRKIIFRTIILFQVQELRSQHLVPSLEIIL